MCVTLEDAHLKIEEIGSESDNRGLSSNQSTRGEEIRRLAQSMVAERAASGLAAQQTPSSQNISSQDQDIIALSDEALRGIASRNDAKTLGRTDQIVSALQQSLDASTQNPSMQQNKGGAQGGKGKKNKDVEKEWMPKVQAGQIHEGREVIGKLRVTEKNQDQNTVGATGKNGNSGSIPGGNAVALKSGVAQSSKNGKSPAPAKVAQKKTEDSSAVQNLKATALPLGKDKGLQVKGQAQSSKESGEASGSGKIKEFDVRGQATGSSQTLTIKGAKKLAKGEKSLGTFRRLDDKPMLKYVTLESSNTKVAAKELRKNATAAGESPEQIQQAVERLKDFSTPDSPAK